MSDSRPSDEDVIQPGGPVDEDLNQPSRPSAEELIMPGDIAYRLDLTAAQLKVVHTALKTLYDDLGHGEHDIKQVVATVLGKLPGEDDMRAIDLGRELRDSS